MIILFVRMKEKTFRKFDLEEFKYEKIGKRSGIRGTFTAITVTEKQFAWIIQILNAKKLRKYK